MPYRDPEKRRASVRESVRRNRAGVSGKPMRKPLPDLEELRFKTARDVLGLLNVQVDAVLDDEGLGSIERARTIAYLAGLLLRAVEASDLTARLEALEAALKLRSAA